MKLDDAIIAITGGAGGLGLAMAERLARAGARLALIDLSGEALAAARERLAGTAREVRTYVADVTCEAQVEAVFAAIAGDFGRLNGLVNNAGIIRDGRLVKLEGGRVVRKMSLADWRAVIEVNLTGAFLCGREAAAIMAAGDYPACIVNVSSLSAKGNMGQTNYSAAKAGLIAMTVTWAKELGPYGIRAAAVAPGFVSTPMLEGMKREALEKLIGRIPLKRLAEPDEIAQAVEFIFANDYFSGRVLEIDGGLRI
ncbi:MAG: 3-ketoacyl-ACP reductase [Porticoccaceae bacterium]|nr:MAG: 3-ketoacyl-ACP reductase [Porticoccaceae bacterium]